jgi:hypothetical protein
MRAMMLFAMAVALGAAERPSPEADLRASWVTDSDLIALGRRADLSRLDLSYTRITDVGFQQLKGLRNVTELDLRYAELIGDGALAAIRDWKKLRVLNLRGTKVTDTGLAFISHLPNLETLDIGYALITDNGLELLTGLPKLKSLAIGGNKMTDVGLNSLRPAKSLEALDLSGMQRTDSGLWFVTVTDGGLESLASLTNLTSLNVRGAKITDAGLEKLAPLKKLEELDLSETKVSAKGLGSLASLPKLQKLTLWKDSQVHADATAQLSALKTLRWLDVKATGMDPAAADQLRAALPGCRVLATQTAK